MAIPSIVRNRTQPSEDGQPISSSSHLYTGLPATPPHTPNTLVRRPRPSCTPAHNPAPSPASDRAAPRSLQLRDASAKRSSSVTNPVSPCFTITWPAVRSHYRRHTARQRLQHHVSERVRMRWKYQDIHIGVSFGQRGTPQHPGKLCTFSDLSVASPPRSHVRQSKIALPPHPSPSTRAPPATVAPHSSRPKASPHIPAPRPDHSPPALGAPAKTTLYPPPVA